MGHAVDLLVASAGRLLQVVQPLLQGGELRVRLVGDPHRDRLAAVARLQHDLAQLAHLLLEALEPLLDRILGLLVGGRGAGEAERQDARGHAGPKNSGIHVRVIPLRRDQIAAKLDRWKEPWKPYRAPPVMAVWPLRFFAQASSPSLGSRGRSLP